MRAMWTDIIFFSLWQWYFSYPALHYSATQSPIGGQLTAWQIDEDMAMSWIRTSAEWLYEKVTTLFHILHSKHNKHFLQHNGTINDIIHKQLRVVFFLYNCYVCLNGCEFSCFFDVQLPSLEDYLKTIFRINNYYVLVYNLFLE
jgi:hypothetical protein